MTQPFLARTRADLAQALSAPAGGEVAAVLTMGALHDGHIALMRAARRRVGANGRVVVTIFVNPLQFAPQEDLSRYPKSFDSDMDTCRREDVDVVFAPSVDEIYPDGEIVVSVDPGALGEILEGAARPGHFTGVLTVVLKLLNLTCADVTLFGEKDFQQLVLVRQMVRDLDLPVEVVGVPIARADDGVALSSRNAYLSDGERSAAKAIPTALALAADMASTSVGAEAIRAAAFEYLTAESGLSVEYVEITDPELRPFVGPGPARLVVAVRAGHTRLLDNARIDITSAGSWPSGGDR